MKNEILNQTKQKKYTTVLILFFLSHDLAYLHTYLTIYTQPSHDHHQHHYHIYAVNDFQMYVRLTSTTILYNISYSLTVSISLIYVRFFFFCFLFFVIYLIIHHKVKGFITRYYIQKYKHAHAHT